MVAFSNNDRLAGRCRLALSHTRLEVNGPCAGEFLKVTAADVFLHKHCKWQLQKAASDCEPPLKDSRESTECACISYVHTSCATVRGHVFVGLYAPSRWCRGCHTITDPSLIPTGDKMSRQLPADVESNSYFGEVQFDVEYNAEQDATLEHGQCEGIGLDEMMDELVLLHHRAAAILHKRVRTMANDSLKSSQRLPAADFMTTGSMSHLFVP